MSVRGLIRGARAARGMIVRDFHDLIMWIQHQMSCGIHMIMVRAAVTPGQPGRNGHARARRAGGECLS
jgi:hypothetical protein